MTAGLRTYVAGKGKIILGDISYRFKLFRDKPEKMAVAGLKFIRRKLADGKYYFIVNNTSA